MGMVSVFTVVFLYQKGYPLVDLLVYLGYYYVLRAVVSFLCAYYVAWVGPKRATLASNMLLVPSLVALTLIETYTLGAVAVFFVFQALSISLYTIASDSQFSSIKDRGREGKEIGLLRIMEKVGTGVAPVVGGFVAFQFGPESIMWVAAFLSIIAAVPLFMTPEKIRRRQRVMYRGLAWKNIRWQLLSHTAAGLDQAVSGTVWSLFVAIVVFGTADNSVYAKLGLVISITFVVSIASSHLYGVLIDRKRAPELFKTGVAINSIAHVMRSFISTPAGVVLVNGVNEVGTSAYQMPYLRSEYDVADNLPGYRVVYLSSIMVVFCLGAALFSFVTAGLVLLFGVEQGLKYCFMFAAVATLLLLRHGYIAF